MELLHLVLDDALAMIDRGEIHDAKTVVGLLLTARRLDPTGDPTVGPPGDTEGDTA